MGGRVFETLVPIYTTTWHLNPADWNLS